MVVFGREDSTIIHLSDINHFVFQAFIHPYLRCETICSSQQALFTKDYQIRRPYITHVVYKLMLYLCVPVDMRPSDKGLSGILEINPHWKQYATFLGLSRNEFNYYGELYQDTSRGLLVLQHWRDGQFGSYYIGTWRFLLNVMKDHLGPVVADKLRAKVAANKTWTLGGQAGRLSCCSSKLSLFKLCETLYTIAQFYDL